MTEATINMIGLCAAIATASLAVCMLLAYGWDWVVSKWRGSDWATRVVCGVFAVGLIQYAATKPGSVSYPQTENGVAYIWDSGSYVTNDTVHVAFGKLSVVPDSADFQGWTRPAGSTNDAEWTQMLATDFAAFHSPSNLVFVGAATNDFIFFTTWTPGSHTITNSMATLDWLKASSSTNNLIPIRTGIYTNSVFVAGPL